MAFKQMQSLVEAAGEALGLTEDPLLSLVGLRIEETVEADLDIENWEQGNSEDADICDLIQNTPGGELQAVKALKRKLQKSIPGCPKASICTLNILENCVRNCGHDFVVLVCQKDYIEDLVDIVINNEEESTRSVQTKLLALIQSWAFEFSYNRDLRGIAEVYMKLKDSGQDFPQPSEDDLKEVDSEDIEAFMRAHEGEEGPVLEVLETLMENQVITNTEETTDEFNKFLQKRAVTVEIEALREEIKKEVESFPDGPDDSFEEEELENDRAIIEEIELELGKPGQEEEVDGDGEVEEDVTTAEFNYFLSKRARAVS